MPEQDNPSLDPALTRALAHEMRIRILERLQDQVSSPVQMAKEFGASVGHVSYHVNVLADCGCLEAVRTRQRRGATEHFFRAIPAAFVGSPALRKAPRSVRGGVSRHTLQALFDKADAALEAGVIDGRDDTTLTCMAITVDETGWAKATEILSAAHQQLLAVHEESRRRLDADDDGTQMTIGLIGFEAVDPNRLEDKPT